MAAKLTTRTEIDTGITAYGGGTRKLPIIDGFLTTAQLGSLTAEDIPAVIEALRLAAVEMGAVKGSAADAQANADPAETGNG